MKKKHIKKYTIENKNNDTVIINADIKLADDERNGQTEHDQRATSHH